MACPFSSMYGATKAFLTEFAASIAPEVRADGVDVTVVHPSPTNSNFYARKDTHALDALAFFKSTATGPERIARKAPVERSAEHSTQKKRTFDSALH